MDGEPDGQWHTRPMPADFPEMFVLLGHKVIEDYYGTSWRVVKRWMRQSLGEAELIGLRRGYLRKVAAAKRYANGRRVQAGPVRRGHW